MFSDSGLGEHDRFVGGRADYTDGKKGARNWRSANVREEDRLRMLRAGALTGARLRDQKANGGLLWRQMRKVNQTDSAETEFATS